MDKNPYKKGDEKLAHEIATKHSLKIYQEWSGCMDGITSFQLSEDVLSVKNNLLQIINNPVIYYVVQEDDNFYYINYLIYHPFDWADHNLWIFSDWINDKDSHRHDTESVLVQVCKSTGIKNMVTVSHYSHLFAWETSNEVIIKSHSHAIKPKGGKDLDDDKRYTIYPPKCYKLVNLSNWSDDQINKVKRALRLNGGVSWLDEQYDNQLKLTTATGRYRSQGLQHLLGDIIKDPGKLIEIGRKCGR